MMLLTQGRIFLEGPVYPFSSVSSLSQLLLCASRHVVFISCTKVVIIYEFLAYSSIMMFLGWIKICPSIQPLIDCNNLVPNKSSICNARVGEWSDRIRVTSKHHWSTEYRSTSNNLLIRCEILPTISPVHGITCGIWRFQIIPQYITERLFI